MTRSVTTFKRPAAYDDALFLQTVEKLVRARELEPIDIVCQAFWAASSDLRQALEAEDRWNEAQELFKELMAPIFLRQLERDGHTFFVEGNR